LLWCVINCCIVCNSRFCICVFGLSGPSGRTVQVRTVWLCSLLLGRHMVVLVLPRTVRQVKPGGPHKGRTVWAKARTIRPCPVASICQAGTTVVVFTLYISSSSYHTMTGATNSNLLPMYIHRHPITSFI
jgi:hypothetical protein